MESENWPRQNYVVTRRQLSEMFGLSMASIVRMDREGKGPKMTRLSERRIGYRETDVEEWLESRRYVEPPEIAEQRLASQAKQRRLKTAAYELMKEMGVLDGMEGVHGHP